ncbi:HNH endonuclease [Lactococcus hodotermopsidis]|uniref:Putative HNH nuclease YajD n=1 Tax=Pseudolactococcus hodotermopsidis TaxID=2709157 RepID=A0A6A0BCE1_9LACT|nr:HNH endonuclease [Lactococcus hodotermopsidis]GFH43032.1 HNH endonuclease [Lactococcus hodotermopsidis]
MIDVSTRSARHSFYVSTAWLKLRAKVLARDNYECIWCKAEGKVTTKKNAVLEVDHIKELEHYPQYALDIKNLRTLCKNCHNKRHGRYQRRNKRFDDEEFEW